MIGRYVEKYMEKGIGQELLEHLERRFFILLVIYKSLKK